MIEIKWLGRGGQGSFTASRLLGLSASLFEGKYALAFPAFGPERRGAPVQAFTKIDNEKITDRSEIKECDYLVILDETLVEPNIYKQMKPGGTILINTKHPEKYEIHAEFRVVTVDAASVALDILKRPVANTAMLGALIGVSEIIGLESAVKGIQHEMPASSAGANVEVLRRIYQLIREDRK